MSQEIIQKNKKHNFFLLFLDNWKFSSTLFALFFFSLLQSYFQILVKFNSNAIFSNSELNHEKEEKFFNFMFFNSKLGTAGDFNWSLMLFSFIFVSYYAQVVCSLIFSFFNRRLTKIFQEEISSKVNSNGISESERDKQKQLIKKDFAEETKRPFVFVISFFQLAFELWFFWRSSLLKDNKNYRLQSYFANFLICLVLYYLNEGFLKTLFLRTKFIKENKSYESFLGKSKILPQENFDFRDVFPTIFSPFYFLWFVPFLIKWANEKSTYYSSLRVDSYLFAAYLNSFIKKILNFIKAAKEFWFLSVLEKRKFFTRKHTQVVEGVSFEN